MVERWLKVLIWIVVGLAVVLVVANQLWQLLYVPFQLHTEQSSEPVNARLWINGKEIGPTYFGYRYVRRSLVTPGDAWFVGSYKGRPFNASYELDEHDKTKQGIAFSIPKEYLTGFTIDFTVGPRGRALNGEVWLKNNALGNISDGRLVIPYEEAYPGKVRLVGAQDGVPFEYVWDITQEELQSSGINLYISEDEMRLLTFDAQTLPQNEIAREVLREINKERANRHLASWRSVPRLSTVAAQQAYDIQEQTSERSVDDRLQNASIYYDQYGENFYYDVEITPNETVQQIAQNAVQNWLSGPSTRALVLNRDDTYDSAGVGVSCTGTTCITVLLTIGADFNGTDTFDGASCFWVRLYDADYPYTYPVSVEAHIITNTDANIYLVTDQETGFAQCMANEAVENIKEWKKIRSFDETLTAHPAQTLVVESADTLNLTYVLSYNS